MKVSFGCNWFLEVYNFWFGVMEGVLFSNDYNGGFVVKLMNKDLGLVLEVVLVSQFSMFMGLLVKSLYVVFGNQGLGGKDFFSIQMFFKYCEF